MSSPLTPIAIVGLPYGDYERVREEISANSVLELRPVDENPHDPDAIEAWFRGAGPAARVGFIPRDLCRAIRLALKAGEIEGPVPVLSADERLSIGIPQDVLFAFSQVTYRDDDPYDFDDAFAARAMAGYRAFFPEDADRGEHTRVVLAPAIAEIMRAHPAMDDEDAYHEALDAHSMKCAAVLDPAFDAPSINAKLGGLPYTESGWDWPICPCCGEEVVFVAQTRDPMAPEDLIQVFHCADIAGRECSEMTHDDLETYSLVRIWRDPDPATCIEIRPQDPSLIIRGHRFDDEHLTLDGDAACRFGGLVNSCRNDAYADDGYHCVMEVWMPITAGAVISANVIQVIRYSFDQVLAFEDDG